VTQNSHLKQREVYQSEQAAVAEQMAVAEDVNPEEEDSYFS